MVMLVEVFFLMKVKYRYWLLATSAGLSIYIAKICFESETWMCICCQLYVLQQSNYTKKWCFLSRRTPQTCYFPNKQHPEGIVKGSAHRPHNCNTAAIVAEWAERMPKFWDANNEWSETNLMQPPQEALYCNYTLFFACGNAFLFITF